MSDDLRARVQSVLPGIRSDLEDLVRIESVSADPERAGEVQRSAEAVKALFDAEGFTSSIVSADGGAPAVIAHKAGPVGAPTVLLYAHHDVQPENDHADWDSPPFEPTERGDRLYARGAADDKAGIAAHLGAVRVFGDDLPVNVVMFIEGEEEVGSETLPALLAEHQESLRADVIVIADSGNWDIGVPALTTSLRGLVRMDIEVRTLTHAVHSGMWGGLVPDSLMALSRVIASLHDDEGNVAIKGLHSGPAADVEYPEERLRAESGAAPGLEWIGSGSAVERLWTKPALSITGLDAPKVAGASNTLVPAARARISMRIAPGDTAENAVARLVEHLEAHTPWGATLTHTVVDTGEATQIDATGPAYDAARSAFTEAWDGTEPIDMGVGGSIPFIAEFLEAFPQASVLV
ncbi:MAG: dipeptidase, partial [Nocardioides sp.]|nr:dipeptidase [Nocardioides sp.]